jgi:hypothetical protein
MILPSKHVHPDRSLIGLGGEILTILKEPMTVSNLWDEVRNRSSTTLLSAPLNYKWFIFALDLLYLIGAIDLNRNLIQRVQL